MSEESMRPNASEEAGPSLAELLEAVKSFLYEALQADAPQGPAREATLLYKFSTTSQQKTDAVLAACLSDWHSFIRELENAEREPMDLDDVVVLLIHRTYNRMRRAKYRDDQIDEQLANGRTRGADGDWLPFDPESPPWKVGSAKNFREEIALVLEDRSPRDRRIIELRYFDERRPREIVERIKQTMPGVPVSEAVVSRVLQRFADDLRPHVSSE